MEEDPTIVVYAIPGSQFCVKVLAVLEAHQIPHFVEFAPVSPDARRSVLPSGGTMVPELHCGDHIVTDSEAILHWLDNHKHTNLFPNARASELSLRASTQALAGLVWYYNWVNPQGFHNSMQKSIAKMMLPPWLPTWLQNGIVTVMLRWSNQTQKHANMAMEALQIDQTTIQNETKMKELLTEELQFWESLLFETTSSDPEQRFFLPGEQPTAADFSVYAQLQRLVGARHQSTDIHVYPSLPDLPSIIQNPQLWKWYNYMSQTYPVHFKGKRRVRKQESQA